MADVKWIKIVTDIFDDEKMLLIESLPDADGIIVVWFKLLCLAGKQNNSGVFVLNDKIPYTDKMLATIFRKKESTVRMALETFERFGMVEIVDGVITIPNWEKHQSLDRLDKIREQTRARVANHREKQKLLADCNVTCNADVTECNATDKIREDKNRLDNNIEGKRKRFTPPTVSDVRAYCAERGNNVDAQRFVDFYTSNGWLVGKNHMKDWKAAVRTWEQRNGKKDDEKPRSTYQCPTRL
ncbi:phage replisome organizer N-terminal domain-containing protein [Pygmaiobacter massiliensis]|uniref:phage replisome organizer N-terminal domain-containing protein n=1 Tax=Pygmaiobacter massiliensis TaxID=1917873 RepID=UPI000C7A516E|nr:phage replisome organizer N-terminal domain-containing protein [Pygmaiobacter massiliensis]